MNECPHIAVQDAWPDLNLTSKITHQKFNIINHSGEDLSCLSKELICLLSCKNYNFQYVGETTVPLNKQINIHIKGKTEYQHVIKHFLCNCPCSPFKVKIIQIFKGLGYENNKVSPKAWEINHVIYRTWKSYNVQYVGETAIPLHKQIKIHRKGKTGCEHYFPLLSGL